MLGHIYWDPNPKIFTLPFIDRPVVWYGLLFALGFFLAYLVFERLIKEYLCLNPFFSKKDFSSISRLLMSLKNNKDHPFIKEYLETLSSSLKNEISKWNLNKNFGVEFEKELIISLNKFLETKPKVLAEINDPRLKKVFLGFKTQRGKILFPRLKKRLKFEELLPSVLTPIYSRSKLLVEKIVLYTLIATIIGSRLGHILFYEDISFYLTHPLDIFKTWEGGLASHGGIIAIALAFVVFKLRNSKLIYPLTMLKILDFSVIAASLASVFIRLGNFMNQEILGVVTNVPWAIIFGHPLDGSSVLPRHPAQLYEAVFYLLLFVSLLLLRNLKFFSQKGRIAATFFTLGFSFRFFIEFLKEEQSIYTIGHLNMGQVLSLPIIVFGMVLFFMGGKKAKKLEKQFV